MKRLQVNEFEEIFGEKLSPYVVERINRYAFEYEDFSEIDRDELIHLIIKTLLDPNVMKSGEHRKSEWEDGWGENLTEISQEKGNINSFINYDDSKFDYDFSFSKKKEVDSQGRKFDNGFDQTIIVGRTNGRLELTCEESCSYDLVIVFKRKVELKENEIKLSVVDNSGDLFDCGRKVRSSIITIPTMVECNKFIPISFLLKYKDRKDELVKVSQGVESFNEFASRRDDFTEIILCNDLDDIVEKVVESEADPIVDMIMELVLSYRHEVSKIITSQLSKKFSSLPSSPQMRRLAKKGEGLHMEYNGVHQGKVYFPNDHDDFHNFRNLPIVRREGYGNGNICGRPILGGPQNSNANTGIALGGHQVSLVNTSS